MPAGAPATHQTLDWQSLLKKGKRVVRVKYGVDEDVCNGDHACIQAVRLPHTHTQRQPRPVESGPGSHRDRRLRRLRLVRRKRTCGHAVPLVFTERKSFKTPGLLESLWAGLQGEATRWLQPA